MKFPFAPSTSYSAAYATTEPESYATCYRIALNQMRQAYKAGIITLEQCVEFMRAISI